MIKFSQFIIESEKVTQTQLDKLEAVLDKLFASLSIDVEFTRHFVDRVNDDRNKEQITIGELESLFRDTFTKHGKKIVKMNPDAQAVIKDLETDINVPFALKINFRTGLLELINKTILRKKGFKPSNQVLKV
jgi:hypothetical protein